MVLLSFVWQENKAPQKKMPEEVGAFFGFIRAKDNDNLVGLLATLKSLSILRFFGMVRGMEALLNVATINGKTPLVYAISTCGDEVSKTIKVITTLIGFGADVNQQTRTGWTALHEAIKIGNIEIVSLLLERGARPDLVEITNLATPLHLAVWCGHFGVVKLLLRYHCKSCLNMQDMWGCTPFDLVLRLSQAFPKSKKYAKIVTFFELGK